MKFGKGFFKHNAKNSLHVPIRALQDDNLSLFLLKKIIQNSSKNAKNDFLEKSSKNVFSTLE